MQDLDASGDRGSEMAPVSGLRPGEIVSFVRRRWQSLLGVWAAGSVGLAIGSVFDGHLSAGQTLLLLFAVEAGASLALLVLLSWLDARQAARSRQV